MRAPQSLFNSAITPAHSSGDFFDCETIDPAKSCPFRQIDAFSLPSGFTKMRYGEHARFLEFGAASTIYAIAYRLQTTKKSETRARRMKLILEMMRKGKKSTDSELIRQFFATWSFLESFWPIEFRAIVKLTTLYRHGRKLL
jgi:hypothetical protein